jgi:PAS domain S-box-containing protein
MTRHVKSEALRKSGLDFIGDVPWGTHLCQFYETKEDLVDILLPYFRAGLENNEFCMWITSPPLDVKEAKAALRKAVPDLDKYIRKGQIQILSYRDWYLLDGAFDSDRVLKGWVEKEKSALGSGFDGLRLTGNTFWLERNGWKAFTDYEEEVNDAIGKYKMMAICTYSLEKCNANEIIDVIKNHQFALIKRKGAWELIESSEKKKLAGDLMETEKKFAALYNSMTEGVVLHDVVYDASGKAVDYTIADVNPSFERITGLSKEQSVGKKASELYGTGEPPYLNIYAEVAALGKPTSFETYFPPMQKHFSISVFSPSKGKFNTVFYDITASKKAEEALRASEQRWATTLSSIGDAVIATDLDGNVTFMNAVAEKLTGWTLKEASKKPIMEVFNIINEQTRLQVEDPVAKVLKKGLIVGLANHTILVRKDRTEVAVDDSGAPIRSQDGRVVGVVLVFRDMTERKRTENELRETRDYLENLLNYANAPIIVWNPEFRITKFNNAFEHLTGLSSNDAIGKNLEILFPSDEKEKSMAYIKRALEGEYWETVEIPILHVDGTVKTLLWNSANIHNSAGNVIATIAQGQDITERKKAEESIRLLKERFEMAQRAAGVGVWDWNVQTGHIEWTPEMFRLFGLDPDKETASFEVWRSVLHPDDREKAAARIDEALKKHSFLDNEYRVVRPDGQVIWVNALGQGEYDDRNQPIRMSGICINITKRKRTEEILREQSSAISSASDAIFSTDNAFTIKSWNKAAENIFGWRAEEVIGKASTSIFNAIYPTLNGTSREQAIEELMSKGFWRGEVIYHKKDGSPIPVSASASPVRDENGKVVGTVAVVHDITARKKREEVLREAQSDLNRAQAVAKTGSWRLDVQRNVLLWSRENHRMFGIPEGTPMTYESFLETVHPDDRKYVDREWQAGLRGEPYDIEHRIVVDGKVKWVRERAELEFDKDGTLLGGFGTTQEITDLVEMRKKLEEYSKHLEDLVEEKTKMLRDSERLAAIGETAGMIGHDIRNPLQAIIGELYLSKDYLQYMPESEAKQELAESMRVIEEQAIYINKIVTDLQDYAKPLVPFIEEIAVEKIIDTVLSTMDIPETIEVSYSVDERFPNLMIDASYMKRILTNLVANAVQAMPDRGKLSLTAFCRGNQAFVCVEDTGKGMSEEAKGKLFKPLFTTKAKGQGFGLAVVKKLTEALNGTITFESEEGKGTKFIIEFPENLKKNAE